MKELETLENRNKDMVHGLVTTIDIGAAAFNSEDTFAISKCIKSVKYIEQINGIKPALEDLEIPADLQTPPNDLSNDKGDEMEVDETVETVQAGEVDKTVEPVQAGRTNGFRYLDMKSEKRIFLNNDFQLNFFNVIFCYFLPLFLIAKSPIGVIIRFFYCLGEFVNRVSLPWSGSPLTLPLLSPSVKPLQA